MRYAFPCELTPDGEGGFVVTFADVPEAITGGRDRAEALTMAEDALATALEGYALEQRAIPTPGSPHNGHAPVIRVEVTAT